MSENLTWQKIFSGQFVFTLATAAVFVYGVYSKIINGEQAAAIIMLVVGFYFNKPKDGGSNATTSTGSSVATDSNSGKS